MQTVDSAVIERSGGPQTYNNIRTYSTSHINIDTKYPRTDLFLSFLGMGTWLARYNYTLTNIKEYNIMQS